MPAKAKKSTKKSEEISFEEAAEKLESIVEAMESDELPLEKLLVRYEQGAKLVKICEDKLEAAEKRITQLEKNMGGELSSRTLTLEEDED
jgi:exodeoxyribonuclease VII small subunit|tara:strand:+ start:2044 stop:2313 length:270 start_codon:yes stop_codon:yes gene_type:complete